MTKTCKHCQGEFMKAYSILPDYCQNCVDEVYINKGFDTMPNVTDENIIEAVKDAYEITPDQKLIEV